jgi:hypothetical protein
VNDKSGQGISIEAFNSIGEIKYNGILQNGEEFSLKEKGIYFLKCTDLNNNVTAERIVVE